MKAIHNTGAVDQAIGDAVANIVNKQIESNSQQFVNRSTNRQAVANIVNKQIESNSQQVLTLYSFLLSCSKYSQ